MSLQLYVYVYIKSILQPQLLICVAIKMCFISQLVSGDENENVWKGIKTRAYLGQQSHAQLRDQMQCGAYMFLACCAFNLKANALKAK